MRRFDQSSSVVWLGLVWSMVFGACSETLANGRFGIVARWLLLSGCAVVAAVARVVGEDGTEGCLGSSLCNWCLKSSLILCWLHDG